MTPRNNDPKSDQDTPGRPKSSASRQQTQPNQGSQTGKPDMESKDRDPRNDHHVRNEK